MKIENKKNWFAGVDSIRFILALLVVASHFENVYAVSLKHSDIPSVRYIGYFIANAFDGTSAVIAFFIISGFVIHYPNKEGISDLRKFWIRRFLRIIIPLAVILIAGYPFGHPEKSVVWSLVCELIYYTVYPFIVLVKFSWTKKFLAAYLVAAVVIVIFGKNDLLSLLKQSDAGYQGYYWQFGWYLTWIAGLPCWLLGVILAQQVDDFRQISIDTLWIYRITIYLVSCFLCFAKFHLHLSYILSMNIFAIGLYKWIRAEITYYKYKQPNQWLERMGKFSYSLYLCHPVVYVTLSLYLANTLFTYPVFILSAIILSYGFYLLVERPAHLIARRINDRHKFATN